MSLSVIQALLWMLIRMVSRRDVEVVVESGKPFLFRKGQDSLKRMSLYLTSGDVSSILAKKLYSF